MKELGLWWVISRRVDEEGLSLDRVLVSGGGGRSLTGHLSDPHLKGGQTRARVQL